MEHTILALAAIALMGIACQWLAWWAKLPAILFLLLTGVLVGPVAGWLDPDAIFGPLLFPFVSLAVAVILFEGGLTLKFSQIRGLEKVVRNLVGPGLLVTWLVMTLAARYAVDFTWEIAFLFGALVTVTGPTVIIPLLRTVRPNARIAELLRWEGIVIDPIGALLAVLVYEFLASGGLGRALAHTLVTFGGVIATGLAVGCALGYALGWLLRSHWMPEYLRNVTTLSVVASAFAGANALQPESGLLAVTVMGIWLANMKHVPLDDVVDFKESLSILLISVLFIVLAARLQLDQLAAMGSGAFVVFLVVQFVARPLKVWLATRGSSLSWREKAVLAWIGPRGIIAAAVSALFASKLEQQGFAQAALLVPLTFAVIIGTVLIQSATARPLARLLGVAEPEPRGVLIVGANPVARAIGKALHGAGFRVLLSDTYWESVSNARREGLDTYYGNPVSELADRQLDLVGIGRLLALSPQNALNALAAVRYRTEFGRNAVFRLPQGGAGTTDSDKQPHTGEGRVLFASEATYPKLAGMLSKGGEVRGDTLEEALDWESYRAAHPGSIALFAVDERRHVHFFLSAVPLTPQQGWTVYALHPDKAPEPGADTSKAS